MIKNDTPYMLELNVGRKAYVAGQADKRKTLHSQEVWHQEFWYFSVDRIYLHDNEQRDAGAKKLFMTAGSKTLNFPIPLEVQGKDYAVKLIVNSAGQLALSSCW